MDMVPEHSPMTAMVSLLAVATFAVGCGDSSGGENAIEFPGDAGGGAEVGTDSCEFANDGTCDEPGRCALGTDETDCREACRESESIAPFVGACAHRNLLEGRDEGADHPDYENPDPSGGSTHLTGWRDGTLEARRSEFSAVTIERHFRVYVPRDYDPDRSYPLMVTMPGHRVSHWVLGGFTMLHRTANLNDFIVVYAGQQFWSDREHWHWWSEWFGSEMANPPGACKQNEADGHPDYEFLRKLVDWSAEQYNIDRRRVYTSGHSRGAAIALMAALDMPDTIAGAAVESGFTECGYLNEIVGEEYWTDRKPTFVFVHGTEDDDVCIDCAGGRSECAANPNRNCSPGLHTSDALVERFTEIGWERGENLKYFRLERVAHDWQAHLNQKVWDFLADRPLPAGGP